MIRRGMLGAAMALAVVGAAAAQQAPAYPTRPIRLIIPWPPGQATDLAARVLAQRFSEILGQPVVPENRAGAGGMIGTDAAAKAAPDGYTLLAASAGPVTINPLLQRTPFDPERDLAPVAMHSLSPYQLVVRRNFPANDIREFIAVVRAAPGRYTFSSSGTGATAHLIAEYFVRSAGLDVVHVPFQGSAPSMTALVAGQVDFSVETTAATNPIVRQGNARGLGISLARGTALAPDVPPIARAADMPGFDAGAWGGIMVPANTPRPIVERLAAAVEQAMTAPEVRERFTQINTEIDYRGTDAFAVYLREQREKFAGIIRAANIRLE